MVEIVDCAGTEIDVDEVMNEEFSMEPERALQTTPVHYLGEASRVATSFYPRHLGSSSRLKAAVSSHKV